jgi:glycosyltransferase involved in cell wall biosynthesis
MSKILYVVHRYAPFPGGSENYVRDMAEETLSRGHTVAVFTGEHKGDWNGVRVSSDTQILLEQWDLIVVHGGNVGLQDFVLSNAKRISSPILFMQIIPSNSTVYKNAYKDCKYIGCSTHEDWDYPLVHAYKDKCVRIRHGINPNISTGTIGFREKYGIKTKYMFLSCGGFWPNKAFPELVSVFNKTKRDDVTLVLTGYDNRHNIKPAESEFVKVLDIPNRSDVMSAIKESDLYIMHSFSEGFGLVILESILNKTPWAARNIAGAKLLNDFGFTYENDDDLLKYLIEFDGDKSNVDEAYKYVLNNHMIKNTVDDILKLVGDNNG